MSDSSSNVGVIIENKLNAPNENTKDLSTDKSIDKKIIDNKEINDNNLQSNKLYQEISAIHVGKFLRYNNFILDNDGDNFVIGVPPQVMTSFYLEQLCIYFDMYSNLVCKTGDFGIEKINNWRVQYKLDNQFAGYIFCLNRKTFAEKFLVLFPEDVAKYYSELVKYEK